MSIEWGRISKTQPKKVEEHVGVAFVAILFGVVVGLIVSELAGEIRSWADRGTDVRISRVTHLLVGVVLTVLSFLGYFASQNRPRHRIYFFNLPLALFILDVLMVFDYYIVLGFTESLPGAEVVTRADARPEAILIAVTFLFYILWDVVSWRIAKDSLYQKAICETIRNEFGGRRRVTITFFFVFFAAAVTISYFDPQTEVGVAWTNIFLIIFLVLYRIAKPLIDSTIILRTPNEQHE